MSAVPEPERRGRISRDDLRLGSLHVIVFGPGHGEAVLLRLPDGTFGVVDGCMATRDASIDPAAELIKACSDDNEVSNVRFICNTHPHDDHIKGLADLMASHTDAERWVVPPVTPRASAAYRGHVRRRAAGAETEVARRNLQAFVDATYAGSSGRGGRWLPPSNVVWFSQRSELIQSDVTIRAVAPSTRDLLAIDGRLIPKESPTDRDVDVNTISAALEVRWGRAGVLLGGDTVNGEDDHSGWNRVHARNLVEGPIQVLKAPHHASAEAHHPPLLRALRAPVSIVTPVRGGIGKQPPQQNGLDALRSTASRVFVTTPPAWYRNPPANTLPTGVPASRHNAVLVSLTAQGDISRIVLAGESFEWTGVAGT